MINFNIPPYIGIELDYVKEAIESHKICGDGQFTKLCNVFGQYYILIEWRNYKPI